MHIYIVIYVYLERERKRVSKTGCPKLAIVNFLGVLFSRVNSIYSDYNHKHPFTH